MLILLLLLFVVLLFPVPAAMMAARLAPMVGVATVGVVTLLATIKLVFNEVVDMLEGTPRAALFALAVRLVL